MPFETFHKWFVGMSNLDDRKWRVVGEPPFRLIKIGCALPIDPPDLILERYTYKICQDVY